MYEFKAEATDVAGNVEHTAYLYGITYDVKAPVFLTGGLSMQVMIQILDISRGVLDTQTHHRLLWYGTLTLN